MRPLHTFAVLLLAALAACSAKAGKTRQDYLVELYAAGMGCVSFAPAERQRACAGVPDLVRRIRGLPSLRDPAAAHDLLPRELEARMYFAHRANQWLEGEAAPAGEHAGKLAAEAEANVRDGLAALEAELRVAGHEHAMLDNLDFLYEAMRYYMLGQRYEQIGPWVARMRATLPLDRLPPAPPEGEAELARLLGIAADIEDLARIGFEQLGLRALDGGDFAAHDRYYEQAREATRAAGKRRSQALGGPVQAMEPVQPVDFSWQSAPSGTAEGDTPADAGRRPPPMREP